MTIADEKYLALTTYRKNGESSATAIWISDLGDGTMGFTTQGSSLKVKRLRNDNRVILQPSDSRGRATEGSEAVTGSAVVASGGAEFTRVQAKIKAKYKWQVTMISLINKIAKRSSDTAIIITLD